MTTAASVVLALDAGQTGIKARLVSPGGTEERLFPGVRTDELLLPQLAAAARDVAAGRAIGTLAVGTSGLTSAEFDATALRHLLAAEAPQRVLLAHDSITSYLGTLGDAHGVVVAAGTGVVTLAVGPAGSARVDGWGYIMGDAGSGYWIGREALDAVMRAHDGRGPETSLTSVVRDRWPDLEDAYVQLQSDPAKVSIVAWFAEAVAAHAEHDEVAAGICRAAAQELGLAAITALRRAMGGQPVAEPLVSAIGGVFRGQHVREAFEETVRAVHPGLRMEAPHGTGLDGAVALAGLPAEHPLAALASVSIAPEV
ncbi:BadF/BadG/BcrA/BcrD ATPase family protein [Homoserinibacter sp. GY 40078]|uniref:BadF/BadG/BcrA/BcrD ATPase family protein n=1 Tax=Homoserinibacter sp. GY 40078 TaxID=2603275 RepID=UPI0011CB95A9|nr:BadF/BadG/BcrA/BcrD ATPase family protein [Homoserinibacter sp. GY 40078]TXK18653.1 hypothetical protein FVQ89_01515 [Homoserinibacter sp. GY 40078]